MPMILEAIDSRFRRARIQNFAVGLPQRLVAALLVVGVVWLSIPVAATAGGVPQLELFEPFLGTWKGLVNEEQAAWDVSRWERVLAGQAVRIRHSVADGAYGGETFIVWDRQAERLVYYYFTTAGFYTHGTMSFDETGRLHSREEVAGQAGGVSEVRSTQEKLADGKIRVESRMLRNGTWDPPSVVLYQPAEGAAVVLPASVPESGESGKLKVVGSPEADRSTVTSVAIRVHRMEAMVAFYTEAFGASFREVDTSGLRSRFAEVDGMTLKLVPLRNSVDFEDYPSHQLGFAVPDVQAVVAIALRHGGRQEGEIQRVDGGGLHASVRDPDGNTLELYGPR